MNNYKHLIEQLESSLDDKDKNIEELKKELDDALKKLNDLNNNQKMKVCSKINYTESFKSLKMIIKN